MRIACARGSYTPLRDADNLTGSEMDESRGPTDDHAVNRVEDTTASLRQWAVVISVLCAVFNIVFVYVTRNNAIVVVGNEGHLPRPNQYIGLEMVNRKAMNATSPEPIVNFAHTMTQISERYPTYIYPSDIRRYFAPGVGTVSPDDRRFMIDEHTNTVAQFRVRDFGMERCQIVIEIPAVSTKYASPTPSFVLRPRNVSIDVWRLDTNVSYFIDIRTLSWKTRPKRAEMSPVTTLVVTAGSSTRSLVFPCQADSVQTFEFACSRATPNCYVDFWQDNMSTSLATFLLQHPSDI